MVSDGEIKKEEYRSVRLRFSKKGAARFISHLDLNRTFKSVIMRTGIRVSYSHGYNPRPKLVFSLPLSIGTGSECEFLDLRIAGELTCEEIMTAFNANLPRDIRITEVYTDGADFKRIAWAEYDIVLKYSGVCDNDCKRITQLFQAPVIITKRTKSTSSGLRDMDIAPFVKVLSCVFSNGRIEMKARLSSTNENYINPEFLPQAYDKYLGIKLDDPPSDIYTVLRTCVYTDDGVTVFR